MNVLVIGSGGREHALCHSINKSTHLDNLYAIPGNPGISKIATCININPLDNQKIKQFVLDNSIDLVIPGSEVYLENGIADTFEDTNILVFGPTKKATKIESSKEFAKNLMIKYSIPTASFDVFDNYNDAKKHVIANKLPTVIKYDGLAGGKGVVVAFTKEDAFDALKIMLVEKKYGNAKVIIEEYLEGPEFSLMCFVKDKCVIPMPIAQDYKRLLYDDLGPNTGGMGAYSCVSIIPYSAIKYAMQKIMIPAVEGMISEGAPFTGFLYGGLILTEDGPKVIEFNARFGDPETEVILPKLETDIIFIIKKLMNNDIVEVKWSNDYYVGVVLASKGYPNSYLKGYTIKGLEDIKDVVFHMGTIELDGNLATNGGRVLLVTGSGKNLEDAQVKAYQNVKKVKCKNLIYRSDIGNKSKKR